MPLVIAGLIGACVTLAGCSAPQPVTTVTAAPSPAVTVTATPSPGDALTSLDAWTVCYGFLTAYAGEHEAVGFSIPELRSYDPKWVTASDGGYQVQISPANLPGDWTCWISGTVGAPKITKWTTSN